MRQTRFVNDRWWFRALKPGCCDRRCLSRGAGQLNEHGPAGRGQRQIDQPGDVFPGSGILQTTMALGQGCKQGPLVKCLMRDVALLLGIKAVAQQHQRRAIQGSIGHSVGRTRRAWSLGGECHAQRVGQLCGDRRHHGCRTLGTG